MPGVSTRWTGLLWTRLGVDVNDIEPSRSMLRLLHSPLLDCADCDPPCRPGRGRSACSSQSPGSCPACAGRPCTGCRVPAMSASSCPQSSKLQAVLTSASQTMRSEREPSMWWIVSSGMAGACVKMLESDPVVVKSGKPRELPVGLRLCGRNETRGNPATYLPDCGEHRSVGFHY